MNRTDISRLRHARSANLQLGLIVALSLVITAFNWTVEDYLPDRYEERILTNELEYEVVRTQSTLPRPQPPQPPAIKIEPVAEPAATFTTTTSLIEPPVVSEPGPVIGMPEPVIFEPAPVPPKPKDEAPPIFKVVEEMPVFGDCTALPVSERKQCSDAALLRYIYRHIRYPEVARDNGIEGTVYVQFVVEKDGSLSQVKILRGIGGGCGREVERVVAEMPVWSPGRQRGRPVRVQFNLPVKFKLQ